MMKKSLLISTIYLVIILAAAPVRADEPSPPPAPSPNGAQAASITEINKELSNPISSLWSIAFQQNNYLVDMGPGKGDYWNSNLNFQPVLPIALTGKMNLITRPVITVVNSVPHPDPNQPGSIERTTSFGDTVLMELLSLSPKISGNWLLGFGPTFIFPTAGSDYAGQGKWQAGPAALVGYLSQKWMVGALYQNWASFGGSGNRDDTDQMNFQPIAAVFLPDGWSIGYSGNILANWKADRAGDTWTVPLGLAIGKVQKFGRLPVKLQLAAQYMVHQPDIGGQQWNIQLTLTPVLPKLYKGTVFGD